MRVWIHLHSSGSRNTVSLARLAAALLMTPQVRDTGISAAGISAAGISAAGISAAGISATGISATGISATFY